jgi:hypothetical protein
MTDKYEIDLNVRPGEDLLDEEMAGNTEERNHPFLQISRKEISTIIPAAYRARDTD